MAFGLCLISIALAMGVLIFNQGLVKRLKREDLR
jgi:hypothetical protein